MNVRVGVSEGPLVDEDKFTVGVWEISARTVGLRKESGVGWKTISIGGFRVSLIRVMKSFTRQERREWIGGNQ